MGRPRVRHIVNDKVYIHELVTITKHNRARYMHHVTANWSPIGRQERGQLCYGVWGVVGSTGTWPQVVNMWEEQGLDGLARSFSHETSAPGMQDPALERWWAAAADLRSGGFDRIVVPHPQTRTIEQLCADGVHATAYAHELIGVEPGAAAQLLDSAVERADQVATDLGWSLVGAWRTTMVADDEAILLWAIPTWQAWADGEKLIAADRAALLGAAEREVRRRHRMLLVDAPLSPLRTGRQPTVDDRTDWED